MFKPERAAERLQGLEAPWEGELTDWRAAFALTPTAFDAALGTIGGGNRFAEIQGVETVMNAATLLPGWINACVWSIAVCVSWASPFARTGQTARRAEARCDLSRRLVEEREFLSAESSMTPATRTNRMTIYHAKPWA